MSELLARFSRAKALGWTWEDAGLTPGLPTLGVKNPAGEVVGVGPWPCNAGDSYDNSALVNKCLDEMGFPP